MKKILCILISVMLVSSLLGIVVFASDDNVTIYVNDQIVQTQQSGIIVNDTTLVPVRVVTEALGCTVDWDQNTQTVIIRNESIWFGMTIGSINVFDASGNIYQINTAPILYNDSYTMVPIRFISENMGMKVDWDQTTTTVFVNSEATFNNIQNTPVYFTASFGSKLSQLKSLNAAGDYYQAEVIIGSVTEAEIDAAKTLDPSGLALFYTEKATTEHNVQLMSSGQPNDIEAQLAQTRAYLDNAISLYNNEKYYEAETALSDFYKYRTTPALVDEYHKLVDDIKQQINYLPYQTLKDIRSVVDSGNYYDAYARINAFLAQTNLNNDVRMTAMELKDIIEEDIKEYEHSQDVVAYRYVTNVSHAVNFRTEASESSTILATIPYSTRVGYVESANSEYIRVKYNNMYGYVAKFYLSDTLPQTQYYATRYINKSGMANVLDQPRGSAGVMMTLPAGTPVGLVEVVLEEYARIDYNGQQGYVHRSQLMVNP